MTLSNDRRDFLKTASLLGFGATVPAFLGRTAMAAPNNKQTGAKDTVLVVVQLTGGNDGLNTVIPFKDPAYAKLRPTLAIPASQVRKLNDDIGLHPRMDGLAGLLQDGSLCVVQGVGYPNPSQSHFRSMDVWQAASTEATLTEGWLGKSLKTLNAPSFHLAAGNESSPLALTGAPARVPSITSLEDFQLKTSGATGKDKANQRSVIESAAKLSPGQGNLLDFVQRTATSTYDSSKRLQEIGKNYQPKSPYPGTPLAERLKLAAQLISAEVGARIFYVSIDGFDTHASQAASHGNLLATVSDAITAFYKDLAARGQKDRVLVMTFSEFGRRAGENGSQGTDHGSGAPVLLVGGKVKAGIVNAHPDLTKLDDGNLKHSMDFRQVYASVLEQWLGVPSEPVLGGKYAQAEIFARK